MAAGESYPALFEDATGQVRLEGTLQFTDSSDQPAGEAVPYKAPATIATDSTGAHDMVTVDNSNSTIIASPDGTSARVQVSNTQVSIAGPLVDFGNPVEFEDTVTLDSAAAAAHQAPQLGQLTSYTTITSGALPQFAAWSSGTAQQNPTHGGVPRQVTAVLAITGDATNNAATCAIAISADNSTFTTVGTVSLAAAVNNTGAITLINSVSLPAEWYIKLTFSHAAVAQSYYY